MPTGLWDLEQDDNSRCGNMMLSNLQNKGNDAKTNGGIVKIIRCERQSRDTKTSQSFSFLTAGEDWVLPLATTGESTTVTSSSTDPASETEVLATALLCLYTKLVSHCEKGCLDA